MIALQVQRYVAKGFGVTVDIQRSHITSAAAVIMQLLAEEM